MKLERNAYRSGNVLFEAPIPAFTRRKEEEETQENM
jgi:hypothetical protein